VSVSPGQGTEGMLDSEVDGVVDGEWEEEAQRVEEERKGKGAAKAGKQAKRSQGKERTSFPNLSVKPVSGSLRLAPLNLVSPRVVILDMEPLQTWRQHGLPEIAWPTFHEPSISGPLPSCRLLSSRFTYILHPPLIIIIFNCLSTTHHSRVPRLDLRRSPVSRYSGVLPLPLVFASHDPVGRPSVAPPPVKQILQTNPSVLLDLTCCIPR
jgi:hypothetical protein